MRGQSLVQQGSPNALTVSLLRSGWELLLFTPRKERPWPGKLRLTSKRGKLKCPAFSLRRELLTPLWHAAAAGRAANRMPAVVCSGVEKMWECNMQEILCFPSQEDHLIPRFPDNPQTEGPPS